MRSSVGLQYHRWCPPFAPRCGQAPGEQREVKKEVLVDPHPMMLQLQTVRGWPGSIIIILRFSPFFTLY